MFRTIFRAAAVSTRITAKPLYIASRVACIAAEDKSRKLEKVNDFLLDMADAADDVADRGMEAINDGLNNMHR